MCYVLKILSQIQISTWQKLGQGTVNNNTRDGHKLMTKAREIFVYEWQYFSTLFKHQFILKRSPLIILSLHLQSC